MRDVSCILSFKDLLGLNRVGIESEDTFGANVICLLRKKPVFSTTFPFLVYSNNYHEIVSNDIDLLEIRAHDHDFGDVLRSCSNKRLGIELTVSKLRTCDGKLLAKAITHIKSLHKLTEKYGNQLVLTSGASSMFELVSGRCFDALLNLCDIKPETYWKDLNSWLEYKIDARCYTCDA
jgi:hypothetical protein